MGKYIKDRIEITATLLVACKLTKEETISELNKLIESVQPISDTELIVPSEEEIRIAGRKHSPTFGYWRSCRTESLIEKQKLKLWKKV